MGAQQYLRQCNLVVADASGNGLNLSQLRIKFTIKKKDAQSPNTCEARIWNLAPDTVNQIQKEFTQLQLQAGYQGNFGLIFKGNIKQIIKGKENGVDTYIDIIAGDGDQAYNFSVINTTLKAGSKPQDHINAAVKTMNQYNITTGYVSGIPQVSLPRAKVLYGMAREVLRNAAKASGSTWSIQDGQVQFVPLTGVLPNQAIVINSDTGMIGAPKQTNDGIKLQCLLNPLIKVGGKIQLNEDDIQQEKVENFTSKKGNNPLTKNKAYKPVKLNADGVYRVLTVEYHGDTRGTEWFCHLVCLSVDATAPAAKSVSKI